MALVRTTGGVDPKPCGRTREVRFFRGTLMRLEMVSSPMIWPELYCTQAIAHIRGLCLPDPILPNESIGAKASESSWRIR